MELKQLLSRFHPLSKQDNIPIIHYTKVIETMKFKYLEKQMVTQCHCFLKP